MLENKIRKFVLRKGLLPGSPFLFISFFELCIILSVFTYVLNRAIKIPITHDEAGTILNFSTKSIWDIITYSDPIPNNHLLNTLLIKFFTWLFGYSEWSCRLPNVIGLLVYLCYIPLIANKIVGDKSLFRLSFLVFMIANPYVIEFFGLARGYGLAVGLMIASIYYLLKLKDKDFIYSLLFGSLALYANLTQLNYFIPLLILVFGIQLLRNRLKVPFMAKALLIIGCIFSLLLVPVKKMMATDQFSYWGNTGFYNETFLPLLKSSLYNQNYFGTNNLMVITALILAVLLFILIKFIFQVLKLKQEYKNLSFILNFLFLGSITYNILQHIVFDIPYLNARTSIFYYPLLVLAVTSSLRSLTTHFKSLLLVLYFGFAFFAILHISRTFNVHSSFEWWFDGDNRKVMDRLEKHFKNDPDKNKISFKCNWLFQPSLTFYISGQNRSFITPPAYTKYIDTAEVSDYYYINSDDMNDWLRSHYTVDTSFAWNSRFLLKKK